MSQPSSYSPSEKNESERLKIQANLSRAIDVKLFQAALKDLPECPLALDIGCAQGYVTFDRFTTLGDFGPVIGIDTDEKAIGTAIEQIPKDWSFEVASIEDPEIENIISGILDKAGNNGKPVFVFFAYVLMHLKDPIRVLEALRKTLPPGSKIVVRTSDDLTSASYPDPEENLAFILEPSVPNPMGGDRKHGRKLYTQLYRAGYRQIEMFLHYEIISNLDKAQREAVFQMIFSWRADGLADKVESGLASKEEAAELDGLRKALDDLKNNLLNPEFFLM